MSASPLVTKVVHCKKEPYDVYIGRPSKWGNPIYLKGNSAKERKAVVAAYKSLILSGYQGLINDIHELKGKTLGCWCHPKECHGDVLAELANNAD